MEENRMSGRLSLGCLTLVVAAACYGILAVLLLQVFAFVIFVGANVLAAGDHAVGMMRPFDPAVTWFVQGCLSGAFISIATHDAKEIQLLWRIRLAIGFGIAIIAIRCASGIF
jgi:hypothetical protein